MPDQRIIAGAMSGTSGDGVDVALAEITGRGAEQMRARLLHHSHHPFDPPLREVIFVVRETGASTLTDLAAIGRQVSLSYARAINEALATAQISSSALAAIAAHGQTLYHAPPDTIQWL